MPDSDPQGSRVKDRFVRDLEPDEKLTSFFLVQAREVRFKKSSGDPYLSLMLSDRTGRIESKMWDNVEAVADTFDVDDIVKVKAAVQVYRDRPQLVIQKLRKAADSEVNLADFIPHTGRDIDQMFAELRDTVNGFQNLHLKALLNRFLDDEKFARGIKTAPAAKTLHHAFVGGLLEHVCSLLNLARLVASNYDYLDLELLQSGVVLHDLGKLDELTYGRAFGYSSDGQLLGHITICLQWIHLKCEEIPDFPPRLKRLIEHMVLSHHGRYEFGSPKLPMFPEALALSYIDDLDSKLESMRASLDAEAGSLSDWTPYNPSLERPLLNTARYLAPAVKESPAAPAQQNRTASPSESPGLFGERLSDALNRGAE